MSIPKTAVIGKNVRLTMPVNTPTSTVDEYILSRYHTARENLPTRAQMLIARIETYVKDVMPNVANTEASVIKAQNQFHLTILGILESEPAIALQVWDILMFIGAKYENEIFNDRTACRFYNGLPSDKQRSFLALMTLIIGTANIRKRELTLRTVKLETISDVLKSEKARTNLAAYYATNI
jgi:hypothetical protein